jgi:hypothetical protein
MAAVTIIAKNNVAMGPKLGIPIFKPLATTF